MRESRQAIEPRLVDEYRARCSGGDRLVGHAECHTAGTAENHGDR
jgi:hypothetical protein